MDEVLAPQHWEADVILRDGRPCHIRPIRPDDAQALRVFHASLSPETVYYRFFAPYPELTEADVIRFTTVDYDQRVALVATVGGDIIGVARFDQLGDGEAEVAFTIRDDHQGRGLGSVLLEHIAAAARERGVTTFVADVLPTNRRMQATFEEAGFAPRRQREDGYLRLDFDLSPTDRTRHVMESRERASEARSIRRLLSPSTVAVIGASRTPATTGHELLRNLRDAGFVGTVYAVHPEADSILGFPCLRSVSDAPVPVDLAVIAVRAERVLDVVDDCARAGVRGLVVVSTGFAETGDQGRHLQSELVARARGNGMRVVGPAALGIVNTDPHVRLNASLASHVPSRGRIGFFCQSGGLGGVILDDATRRGLGLSSFVSAGNRSDVSGNDLLQYWRQDPATDVVLLYLESIGNPRKFTRIVRRLARDKPVVAVRSGRSSQSVPLGHRVRTTSLPAAAVDAVFDQCGVIQTASVREMLDVASVLSLQPAATSTSVAVVASGDALGLLTADAARAAGLDVASTDVVQLPLAADALTRSILAADANSDVGIIIVAHVPPLITDVDELRSSLHLVVPRLSTPVVVVTVDQAGESGTARREHGPADHRPWIGPSGHDGTAAFGAVPVFSTAEEAVRAAAAAVQYAQWRAADVEDFLELEQFDVESAMALCDDALAGADERRLDGSAAHDLLRGMGVLVDGDPGDGAVACRIQVLVDDLFGPVIAFGLAGRLPELVGDRAYAAPPLSAAEARALVRRPAGAALLSADLPALETAVERLAALADSVPSLSGVDLVVLAGSLGVAVETAEVALIRPEVSVDDARRLH